MEGKATEVNRLNHAATPATPPLAGTKASAANEGTMNIELILKEKKSQIAKLQADVKAIEKVIGLLSGAETKPYSPTGQTYGMTKVVAAKIESRAVGSTFKRKEIGESIKDQFPNATKERFDSALSNALFRFVRAGKLSITRGEQSPSGFQHPSTYTKL